MLSQKAKPSRKEALLTKLMLVPASTANYSYDTSPLIIKVDYHGDHGNSHNPLLGPGSLDNIRLEGPGQELKAVVLFERAMRSALSFGVAVIIVRQVMLPKYSASNHIQ